MEGKLPDPKIMTDQPTDQWTDWVMGIGQIGFHFQKYLI